MRSFALLAAAAALPLAVAAEDEKSTTTFQDTPLTTELWKLVSKSDTSVTDHDSKLEQFLYDNPSLATARAADHRGGLWWAWEYENVHALAALKVYGEYESVKLEEQDQEGMEPFAMCAGDKCGSYEAEANALAEEISQRRKEKKENAENIADLDEDDDESSGAGAKADKAGADDDNDSLDDDDQSAGTQTVEETETKTTTEAAEEIEDEPPRPKKRSRKGGLDIDVADDDDDEEL